MVLGVLGFSTVFSTFPQSPPDPNAYYEAFSFGFWGDTLIAVFAVVFVLGCWLIRRGRSH